MHLGAGEGRSAVGIDELSVAAVEGVMEMTPVRIPAAVASSTTENVAASPGARVVLLKAAPSENPVGSDTSSPSESVAPLTLVNVKVLVTGTFSGVLPKS